MKIKNKIKSNLQAIVIDGQSTNQTSHNNLANLSEEK